MRVVWLLLIFVFVCRYVDLRWDVFLGTYYHWRVIKGVPLVSHTTHTTTQFAIATATQSRARLT